MVYLYRADLGYKYILTNVRGVSWRGSTNPTEITLPSADPILFNLDGIKKRMGIDWYIKDESIDLSGGTYTSTVSTIKEQIDYLEQYFITPDVGVEIQIVIEAGEWGADKIYSGKPLNFTWTWEGGKKFVKCRLDIMVSSLV